MNTYGTGNWARIFNDVRFCFLESDVRKKEHLCPKWRNLKDDCKFDEFFYLIGKKELCKPVSVFPQYADVEALNESITVKPKIVPIVKKLKKKKKKSKKPKKPKVDSETKNKSVDFILTYKFNKLKDGYLFNFKDNGINRRLVFRRPSLKKKSK